MRAHGFDFDLPSGFFLPFGPSNGRLRVRYDLNQQPGADPVPRRRVQHAPALGAGCVGQGVGDAAAVGPAVEQGDGQAREPFGHAHGGAGDGLIAPDLGPDRAHQAGDMLALADIVPDGGPQRGVGRHGADVRRPRLGRFCGRDFNDGGLGHEQLPCCVPRRRRPGAAAIFGGEPTRDGVRKPTRR